MFNINEVIGFIIRSDHAVSMADMQDSDLTHLKLQKLLYYSQGHFLGRYKKPLFADNFIAWQHGPVVKEIYHGFKTNGSELIGFDIGNQKKYDCLNLLEDKDVYALLKSVINYYNQYSPWKLRDMSHADSPWKDVKIGDLISQESIMKFFSQEELSVRI